jgi:DNA-binding GntR family transcriptional regulator
MGPSDLDFPAFSAPTFQRAAEVAEDAIKHMILKGQLQPGTPLPEAALAERFGLSRTPVREALMSLQAAGLVEMNRGQVAQVRSRTPEDLLETYELRAVVEGFAAGQSAQFIPDKAIDQLRESCRRFEEYLDDVDAARLIEENERFHHGIHRFTDNARILPIIAQFTEMPLRYNAYAWYSRERRVLSLRQHRAIVDALSAGDSRKAEQLMREHVKDAGAAVLLAINESTSSEGLATLGA